MTYNKEDLSKVYGSYCGEAVVECRLTREIVGGQPASAEGVRAFALHHLKIPEGPELEAAILRILGEEIGERETTPETGEVKERESYGLNVLRRDEFGPWIGDWQIKAALKQAASRVGLFVSKRGSKGDMAEMGHVTSAGISVHGEPFKVYLMDPVTAGPAKTFYQRFMGRVNTPTGAKSIVSDAECAPAGSLFSFRLQWYNGKLSEKDMVSIFAALPVIGLGSAKSLERGKFDIESLEVTIPKKAVEGAHTAA